MPGSQKFFPYLRSDQESLKVHSNYRHLRWGGGGELGSFVVHTGGTIFCQFSHGRSELSDTSRFLCYKSKCYRAI